jgi:hypothetical protein
VSGKRIRMQIARPDRGPGVVNQHEFRMHVGRTTTPFCVSPSNAGEQKVLMATERLKPIEQRPSPRVQTGRIRMIFRDCWD